MTRVAPPRHLQAHSRSLKTAPRHLHRRSRLTSISVSSAPTPEEVSADALVSALDLAALETAGLPLPPTDQEKYEYLKSKKRWVMLVQLVAYAFVMYSTVRFVLHVEYTEWFYIPIAISCAWAVMSFATTTQGRRDTQPSHDLKVELYAPAKYPSVDVYLPSCGEPLEVIHNAYRYIARLRWPGELQVHVLDDAASADVEKLALHYGFIYHV